MTEIERDLILQLLRQQITKEEFRQQFHPELPLKQTLLLNRLTEAFDECNSNDVQFALVIGSIFGCSSDHVLILCQLLDCDWHRSHEDIVTILEKLADPRAIPFLLRAAYVKHDYLAYDLDTRALAYRIIWALSKIGDSSSLNALEELASSGEPIVSEDARERLDEMISN